jgi:alpha-tubulin suppressor-like RCC1 family protein
MLFAVPPAAAATSHATTVASGVNHACAVRSGKAYCWGDNSTGQLGTGKNVGGGAQVAVSTSGVLSGKTLTQISAGDGFTCALDSGGAVYCWGANAYGQLGNGSAAGSGIPVAVSTSGVLSGKTLTQITAGQDHVCTLDTTGRVYCWGGNGSGQLGNASTARSSVPVAVSTSGVLSGKTVTQISAGGFHTCALASTGAAYCWGGGGSGQLGNNATGNSSVPVTVYAGGVLSGVTLTQISAGHDHTCAVDGGAVYCWGHNGSGELGNNSTANSPVPVAVTTGGTPLSGKTINQITAGYETSCALDSAGLAYCWGHNAYGQLGNGSTTSPQTTATAVTTSGVLSGKTLSQLSAGQYFMCTVGTGGAIFCWGANGSGRLGNPSTTANSSVPEAVTAPRATTIAAGYRHSCAIRAGLAYCWGDNTVGDLGRGTTGGTSNVPGAVSTSGVLSGKTLTQIEAGQDFTCALDTAGAAYCWGFNAYGQLGNNSTTNSNVPVQVTTTGTPLAGKTLTEITVGNSYACALDTAGKAYCWGYNGEGQLGNGTTTTPQTTATAVSTSGVLSGKTLVQVSAGYDHSCAVDSAGVAYCWGYNGYGGLGNNNTTQQNSPVAVTTASTPLAGKTVASIAAGNYFTCALDTAGLGYCWGRNNHGQLGNSTTDGFDGPHPTATAVTTTGALSGKSLAQLTLGEFHVCAADTGGAGYCWGQDNAGQLGNGGTNTDSNVAVAVNTGGALSGKSLVQISAEYQSTCGQDSSGALYCWGLGTSGQLGNNAATTSTTAVVVVIPGPPTSVTAFPGDTTATVRWAAPSSFGTGTLTGYTATAYPGGASCTTTGATTCAITGLTNGISYSVTVVTRTTVGDSVAGGPATATPWPAATKISSGYLNACTISGGKAYCWGDNTSGQLGNGTTTSSTTPVAVSTSGVLAGKTLTQISVGYQHVCALDTAGAVYCWGDNSRGELGNGTTTSSSVPVAVSTGGALSGKTVAQISANGSDATPFTHHTCALDTAGAAYCWGDNTRGELGNGNTTQQNAPVAVTTGGTPLSGKTLTQITTGSASACVLDSTGAAYCWGDNTSGQLGNNTTSTSPQTTAVTVYTGGTLSGVALTQISGGYWHTCALASTGAAYCWGYNVDGELGNGGTTTTGAPVTVTATGALSGKTLAQVGAGGFHTCALDAGGAGYCWGFNTDGRLGNNTTTSPQTTPSTVYTGGVLSGKTVTQIGSGRYATCAQDSAGADYCWGRNTNGQLGNNSTANSNAAVLVAPQAPTGVSAVPGDGAATVSWSAPVFVNNGTITGYAANASPGGGSCSTASATSCTITGLTNGVTYTVTVEVTATTGTATSDADTVTPVGFLTVSAQESATLPPVPPGSASSEQLGTVTVTDNRGEDSTAWTATVASTSFTGPETIPASSISYWSGPTTAFSGPGTFIPGQPTAVNAVDLSTTRTAFSMTGGSGVNSASWDPTLSVSVPASAVGGAYTATVTTSVS